MKKVKLSQLKLTLTKHAYDRYVERVGPIEMDQLAAHCKREFKKRYNHLREWHLVEIGGAWWSYRIHSNKCLNLTTCYGRSDVINEASLKWQITYGDRINFEELGLSL